MSEHPLVSNAEPITPDPNDWERVVDEMRGWHPDLQQHAMRHLDARGIDYGSVPFDKTVSTVKETHDALSALEPADAVMAIGNGNAALSPDDNQSRPYDSDTIAPNNVKPDKDQRLSLADQWLSSQDVEIFGGESIPAHIAGEIALLARHKMNVLEAEADGFISEEIIGLNNITQGAIKIAEELDFELVKLSSTDWPTLVRLNTMHDKFKEVSHEALSTYLDCDESEYEYRALRIRDIIAEHAPELLTENLKTLVDPSQPLWRASSVQASILLRRNPSTNIEQMHVEQFVAALPVSTRREYLLEDDATLIPVVDMTEDDLSLYCRAESVSTVMERGYATFKELNVPAREALLTRRIFETTGKSQSETIKEAASARNRALEHEPALQSGDLVHATSTTDVFETILFNGLRCGEAIMGNNRSIINYPMTVGFLQAETEPGKKSLVEQILDQNNDYGPINIVLHRAADSVPEVDYPDGQQPVVANQRQIFGGVPSTDIKSVILRDEKAKYFPNQIATEQTIQEVINAIVKYGVFIPVYRSSNGEQLLSSQQFDRLSAQIRQ